MTILDNFAFPVISLSFSVLRRTAAVRSSMPTQENQRSNSKISLAKALVISKLLSPKFQLGHSILCVPLGAHNQCNFQVAMEVQFKNT